MSRRLVRSIRNINSTPAEIKIKSSTSNDSFGPTTSELNEIALLTNDITSLRQITNVISKRINDSSRNWRHILKSLTVIQYCILAGSIEFVYWIQNNAYLITTLKEFQLKDSNELAYQIRNKAKIISKLLKDDKLLESKRSNYHLYRTKMSQPATGKRSSLDITRADELHSVEEALPSAFIRGTQSLEIRRSDWDNVNHGGSSKGNEKNKGTDEISQILADIDEE